ncbi:hypothetical protein [Synoicihabitans lomoniglobus]|uniref:hypothetical protein n=1 Tax=Synoicihabitans lomoniglobus TaxID=2909285 RepID=UPI002ED26E83|nr:hypothetical protein [Opitutaceae bacterium LMO-M01]
MGVGCGVLAVLLTIGSYVRAGNITELEATLEERTRLSERYKNNLRYANRLQADAAKVKEATDAISRRAIDPSALATNLQFFYRLESELDLRLIDLRQGIADRPKKATIYSAVPYTVAVEGTYIQLMDFVRRLETGGHYVRFQTSNFNPSREAGGALTGTDPKIVLSLNLQLLGRQ